MGRPLLYALYALYVLWPKWFSLHMVSKSFPSPFQVVPKSFQRFHGSFWNGSAPGRCEHTGAEPMVWRCIVLCRVSKPCSAKIGDIAKRFANVTWTWQNLASLESILDCRIRLLLVSCCPHVLDASINVLCGKFLVCKDAAKFV